MINLLLSVLDFALTLIILILMLGLIVFIHELGHFLAAKKKGVYVYEFAVGMGPKIFSFKRKNDETEYSLRLFPLGGFTALASDIETSKDLKKEQILENKSALSKFFVLIMGIVFNVILAIILFFINGLIFGSPVTKPYVGDIVEGSPADASGLKSKDLILSINDAKVHSWDDVILETRFLKEEKETFTFRVLRDNEEIEIVIKPNYEKGEEDEIIPVFGFTENEIKEKGFLSAVKYAFRGTYENAFGVFNILGKLVTGKVGANNLSGPVGVFSVIDKVKETGLETIIYLTAYLSINVAIINLIPVPVFDGGRILLLVIEKILNRKLNKNVETIINNIGAILLILLMIYVTLNDILKLF